MRLIQSTDGVLAVMLVGTPAFITAGTPTAAPSASSAATGADDGQLSTHISTGVIPLLGLLVLVGPTLALAEFSMVSVIKQSATPPDTGSNANTRRSPPAAKS